MRSLGSCIPAVLTAAILLLPSCTNSNKGVAVVSVTGPAQITLGTTGQLAATTTNSTDTGYTWSCSDDTVCSIDATGLITPKTTGSVTVTAKGATTQATGTWGVTITAVPGHGVPFYDEWVTSGHADSTAEAFVHWDGDGSISTSCAKCHSTHGIRDFLGDDGTAVGVVDNAAALGTTVECEACHNPAAVALDEVTFPSGVRITGLGHEAICMQCHQGRNSTDDVDAAIVDAAPANVDAVMPDRGFINIHYFPAAATRYGGQARGGYLYSGKSYDARFRHAPGAHSCQECHDPHTLDVRITHCATCHTGATTTADLKDIRMDSSVTRDYDGDGNLTEGLWYEVEGLRTMLYQAIQAYAANVLSDPIIYDSGSYPYFFKDTNGNGAVDSGEATYGNKYSSFSARLLKATFNYQYATKDPGGYAHNGKFIVQLLYDSIEDLNGALSAPVSLASADRDDVGHFDGTAEAFRHWDDDGDVSASCAKCHAGSEGYKEFLTYGANTSQEIANGMDCETCHTTFDTYELRRIDQVTFASGLKTVEADSGTPTSDPGVASNLCLTCHQGRVSKATIDQSIADNVLKFLNVHYLAAGATLFGADAQVGYEYPGKTYVGKWIHSSTTTNNNCTDCHSPDSSDHSFSAVDNLAYCQGCHTTITAVDQVRVSSNADYDGDGSTSETLKDEVATLSAALYAQIQAAAAGTGNPIVYEGHSYPYFFKDTNGNGNVDPGEAIYPNSFKAWTPALMKAAHNYQQSLKEHGAWVHNFAYITQLLIDSIEDLGGNVSAYTRP